MKRRTKMDTKEVKVAFEVVAGRQGGRGIFAIEDAAEEIARRTKLAHIAEQIASYDRGYAGNRRRCPQCGKWRQYKGERAREVVFDCGTVTVVRAIKGQRHVLWRAVDQDGNVLDILVQRRRDKRAAKKFFRKLLKGLVLRQRGFEG